MLISQAQSGTGLLESRSKVSGREGGSGWLGYDFRAEMLMERVLRRDELIAVPYNAVVG